MLSLEVLSLCFATFVSLSAQPSLATTVCSTTSCLNITATLSSLPQLGGTSSNGAYLLLPGTYSQPLPSALQANTSSFNPLSGLTPLDNYTRSDAANPFYLLPSVKGATLYTQSYFAGKGQAVEQGGTATNDSVKVGSLVLSPASWLKVKVGNEEKVVWSSVADVGDSSLGIGKSKALTVVDAQSTSCSTPCTAGGSCVAADVSGSIGTCVCAVGFTGAACEECAEGHWGPSCLDCASHCDTGKCDDGLTGTGQCAATVLRNSTTTCNCLNGQCAESSSTCTCSSGWASPNITANRPSYALSTSHLQCSICAPGFTSSNGECVSCGPYANACSSPGTATACVEGYEVELGACVASNGPSGKGSFCSGANYWESESSSCSPCSPACGGRCSGPSSTECLSCAPGKGLLSGSCVDVDSTKGTCDQAAAGFGKTQGFWWNRDLGACDTCPAQSTACTVKNFSSSSTRSSVQATACIPGYLLSTTGQCVKTCPDGEYHDGNSAVCHVCRNGCQKCSGYSAYCTQCSSGQFAFEGSCISSCGAGSFAGNGTCTTCHGDCATCSGSGFNQCLSCPSNRPVLYQGRCLPVCAKGQYFDSASSSCKSCDSTCSSCTGPSASQCLSCAASDHITLSGACVLANCTSSLVPFLSVCLDTLVANYGFASKTKKTTIHILTILIPLLILLVILGAILFVRHERRRTREASQRFANGMDDIQVAKTQRAAFGTTGVDDMLGLMARTKEDLERRWRERSEVKRVRELQKSLRPLELSRRGSKLESNELDFDSDEDVDYRSSFRSNCRRYHQRQHPPPYTPSATDNFQSHTLGLDSDDSDDGDRYDYDKRRTRPLSRYTIDSELPPSPAYDSVTRSPTSRQDPFSRDSLLSVPTLSSPPLAACPRPSHFRSQTSIAPSNAVSASRSRRSFDLEDEPFPDFQQEYLQVRERVPALPLDRTRSDHSQLSNSTTSTSRFFEDDASDVDAQDCHSDHEGTAVSPALVQLDSPASLSSPPVIRGHYWLADTRSEGGLSAHDITFAPSPSPGSSTRVDAGGRSRLGTNNPFQSAWV